jgi:hypothetical protein
MPIIKCNFSNVRVFQGAELLPTGLYKLKIEDAVSDLSMKGNPVVKLQFKCVETLGGEEHRSCIGRTLRRSYPSNGEGAFRLKRLFLAVGFLEEDLAADVDIEVGSVVGLHFWALIRTEKRADGSGDQNELVEQIGELAERHEDRLAALLNGGAHPGSQDHERLGNSRPGEPR